jgi:hypothetical protein
MLPFNPDRVLLNARSATTEDLLDRVTVYRAGMEPQALDIIEAELRRRGVGAEQIATHAEQRQDSIFLEDGTAAKCSFCHRPAVAQGWAWHRLWGKFPLFPRYVRFCEDHRKS